MNAPARPPAEALLLDELAPNGVRTLTLNRPGARNALSMDLMGELTKALEAAAADQNTRTIVLQGAGPAFCAGHDLKEMTARRADPDKGEAYFRATFAACTTLMQAILQNPKPVIAAVHGIATAAGCQLVATCDLAIAAETAKFATPGVNIGLFCSTPMVALSRNVSRKAAMEMLLTADMVPAREAERVGLVNRVVPDASLATETNALAARIASKSMHVNALGKRAFYRQLELGLSDAYLHASEVMTRNMLDADAIEGIDAFLGKRDPKWQDR